MYRRYQRYSKPTPRNITARFAGVCVCCGSPISAGEIVTYYPAGTIAGVHEGKISHIGGLEGNSKECSANLQQAIVDKSVNDYAGDGLDSRYEDDCASKCGL